MLSTPDWVHAKGAAEKWATAGLGRWRNLGGAVRLEGRGAASGEQAGPQGAPRRPPWAAWMPDCASPRQVLHAAPGHVLPEGREGPPAGKPSGTAASRGSRDAPRFCSPPPRGQPPRSASSRRRSGARIRPAPSGRRRSAPGEVCMKYIIAGCKDDRLAHMKEATHVELLEARSHRDGIRDAIGRCVTPAFAESPAAFCTAGLQRFNLEELAQPWGALDLHRAFRV